MAADGAAGGGAATALPAMTVGNFLEKANALEKRGVTALFSADFRLLKSEVQGASEAVRGERLAAQRAGDGQPTAHPTARA